MSRCDHTMNGKRCADSSGSEHGHWYRPDALEPDLHLTRDEAVELLHYMRHEYLNPNRFPHLTKLLDRLEWVG